MSKYSGKCDCYDSLIMINKYTDEELADKVKICQGFGVNEKRLNITSRKDLIPYYAHLVSAASYDNVEHKATIYLSTNSWVDIEERESLEYKLKRVMTIYNRCKRKKIDFDVDAAVEELAWKGFDDDIYREIANRVKANGRKADITGIHLKLHEHYRRELVDEMIRNGLNPLDYGDYKRFLN